VILEFRAPIRHADNPRKENILLKIHDIVKCAEFVRTPLPYLCKRSIRAAGSQVTKLDSGLPPNQGDSLCMVSLLRDDIANHGRPMATSGFLL
jgi:hypothetical protein